MMNRYRIILPLLSLFATALCVEINYKEDYCDLSPFHMLCSSPSVGSNCRDFYETFPDLIQQKDILDWHNGKRQQIATGYKGRNPQRPASNMMKMQWDTELAVMAQVAANQCLKFLNCSECRGVLEGRFAVGQNSASEVEDRLVPLNFTKLMQVWFDEHLSMNPDNVNLYVPSRNYESYSQLVWWNTRSVGCGGSMYKSKGVFYPFRYLVYCLYGPAGNIPNTRMYLRGVACSRCPEGTTCDRQFPGLCSINRTDFNVLDEFSTDKVRQRPPPGSIISG